MNIIQYAAIAAALSALAGCATPPKEHTAPCKRPANALGFADDPRTDCGPMHAVNDADRAMTAILSLEKQ